MKLSQLSTFVFSQSFITLSGNAKRTCTVWYNITCSGRTSNMFISLSVIWSSIKRGSLVGFFSLLIEYVFTLCLLKLLSFDYLNFLFWPLSFHSRIKSFNDSFSSLRSLTFSSSFFPNTPSAVRGKRTILFWMSVRVIKS